MTVSDPKRFYSAFLKGHADKLHFAAHSHHFWPDVTREAQLAYWDDSAKTSDEKWDNIFSQVIPTAQKHVAKLLHLKDHEQIVFAPNTHELLTRILSLFFGRSEISIVTTSSEFHSWKRQLSRMMELPSVKVDLLSTENILLKKSDFIRDIRVKLAQGPDLFFMSQVFFDSGIAFTDEELLDIAKNCPEKTLIVIDGYHGFAALPTNLSQVEGRIFYLAGGYKYAQAGEGACFLVVPKGNWRPAYTGWYAEFGDLSRPKGTNVGYTNNGMAFMGSTQDPSALYRFNSVWDLYQQEGITLGAIHKYVKDLQLAFIKSLPDAFLSDFKLRPLYNDLNWHGHFLTFESTSELDAQKLTGLLKEHGIIVDRRGQRIRFGFGLYQDMSDVIKLVSRLKKLADLNL